LQLLANTVIKPLMFATEKVIEQYTSLEREREREREVKTSVCSRLSLPKTVSDQSQTSKRTFKQLNRDWDFTTSKDDDDTLIAIQGNKRQIKLEKKLVSKICRAAELNKGRQF